MKRCSYCGREYPDDATTCLFDNESLLVVPLSGAGNNADSNTKAYLTFPDYKWSAGDAWKYLGIVIVFEFVAAAIIYELELNVPRFTDWQHHGSGYFTMSLLYFVVFVITAAYFARTETLPSFWTAFGLNRKPSRYVWVGIVLALMIRFSTHFVLNRGWGKGVWNYDVAAFQQTRDFERCFFLFPSLVLAPIFEETTNRGFLYKAFRGSYQFGLSTALIISWTAITHWAQYSHSFVTALALSVLTVVQCYLREKSNSLWDCIIPHFTFNASVWLVAGL